MSRHDVPWRLILVCALIMAMQGGWANAEPSADDVVAGCIEAMGGAKRIEALQSLTFRVGAADSAKVLYWEIRRPDKVRKERPDELTLVFDGSKAGFLMGPRREDGTLDTPHLVPEEDWHHFEMDIALYIPAFFDHPALLLGFETVSGVKAHILQVDLPLGGRAVYAIDAESFLPIRVSLPGWDYHRYLGGFEETDGLIYPRQYRSGSETSEITLIEDLRIDTLADPSRFVLPPTIEQP